MIKTFIIDRGHATLDKNGKYSTPGKQAKLSDGRHVYEGFENQKYCEAFAVKCKEAGYKVEYTVKPNDPTDVSLTQRVRFANALPDRFNSIFVSFHNNAGGNQTANGTEIFTSVGKTMSDTYAEAMLASLKKILPERRIRAGNVKGQVNKEENFQVLRTTLMPAVLIEAGFFDNPTDYDWLSNPCNIDQFCKAILQGVIDTDVKLYGKEAWETRNF